MNEYTRASSYNPNIHFKPCSLCSSQNALEIHSCLFEMLQVCGMFILLPVHETNIVKNTNVINLILICIPLNKDYRYSFANCKHIIGQISM